MFWGGDSLMRYDVLVLWIDRVFRRFPAVARSGSVMFQAGSSLGCFEVL
jgi:hypothetical protein